MEIINSKHMNLKLRESEFLNAIPFPYLVLDDFLQAEYFSSLKSIFKDETKLIEGESFNTVVEEKKWISKNSSLPEKIKQIVDVLNSEIWVQNIRGLTGVDSLVATPYGNTELANYHVMEPGAILGSHVDHSHEPVVGTPHVLNVLIYLTEDWNECDGGATFLYDKTGKNIISKVQYKQNRAVIFLHTPYSFHGVERINNNAKLKRKSIYVDYYSESFQPYDKFKLNFNSKWFKHGTTFKLDNYLDYFKPKNHHYTKALIQYNLNKLKAKYSPFSPL